MALAVVIPHPVSPQLGRHTYLCVPCNRTRTYILRGDPSVDSNSADTGEVRDDRRRDPRAVLNEAGTIYHKDGNFLLPCTVRDVSTTGARLALFKEAALPQYFLLSMMPDGSGRRLCSKVWQLNLIAGVRFAEKS